MRKILVATHASFAQGIKDTLTFIMGEQSDVDVMCAYLTQDFDLEAEIERRFNFLHQEDELIVLVDVFGGSVANAFLPRCQDPRIHLLTGVNFPMLLELTIGLHQEQSTQDLIQKVLISARHGIQYMNDAMQTIQAEGTVEEEVF